MGEPRAMRRSGIDVVGEVPWGTHFCQFYQTSEDLIETLVPYFREGLAANEFCMWVTSEPVRVDQAAAALRAAVPDLDGYARTGQIEILDFSQWYTRSGRFSVDEVLRGWVDKLNAARQHGYEGLRLTGNTFWLEPAHWDDFTQYEEMVNNVIGQYRMLALCTYSLLRCGATEIMDVVSNHEFALIKRAGQWQIIESAHHKQTEQALRDSEHRYRALFTSMNEGSALAEIVYDGQGRACDFRLVEANPAFSKLTGFDVELAKGTTARQLLPDVDRHWIETCRAVVRTGQAARFESRLTALDKWFQVHAFPAGGDRFGALFIDITERKQAEQALHASQDRLNRAEEIAHLGSWELDLAHDRLTWSDEVYRLFGLRPQEFGATYEAFLESVHPEDRAAVDAAYRGSLREGRDGYEIEHRVVRKGTGEIRVVHEKCQHVRDASGKIIRSVGMVLDITDRKRAEAEIGSLARFPEENPNPVMRAAAGGELLYANRPAMSLLETMGWRKGGRLPEALARPLGRVLKAGVSQEVEFRTSSGRVYAFTLSSSTGEGRVNLYGRDRTKRKEAEEALARARDELEHRVRERTAELNSTLDDLQAEVRQRIATEGKLRESNELLESMFANIHLCVAYMDGEFNLIRVNDAYAAAAGHEPEFFVDKNHFALYPHEENEAICRRAVRRGETVTFTEKPFEYPDQPERGITYWDWTLRPVTEDGRVIGVLLSMLDVTERVLARAAVETERKRLFSVLNLVPGYVALKDRAHQICFANHGYLELFGEPSGRSCYEVQFGRSQPCDNCRMPRVLDSGRQEDWEWTHPNGQTYHVWVFPFTDTDGTPLMMQLGLNVTDRKRLESMVAEASEAERRRVGRDLHDTLGQSLTGLGYLVGGLSEKLAATSPQDTAVAKQIIETVKEAVGQVRALSRGLDPIGLEADGLANALGELACTFRATSGVSCEFRCDCPVSLEAFTATHLYRIAQEALTNAARHAHAKHVVVSLTEGVESLSLRLEDDGIGIAAGARDNEGMGLRVMRYRAGAIGATLAVSPGRNAGTVVTCTLSGNTRRTQAGREQR